MSKTIFYDVNNFVDPRKINVVVDKYFYTHHGRKPEEWNNLLEIAKLTPDVWKKKEMKIPLTSEERNAYSLYFGELAPTLELSPNGQINVSDGRHRMQALKELNLSIPMQQTAYIKAEPVKDINDMYKEEGMLFFKRSTNELNPDISYTIVQAANNNIGALRDSTYKVINIKDFLSDADYVFVSKNDIKNRDQFKVALKDFEKNNIQIYYTHDNLHL